MISSSLNQIWATDPTKIMGIIAGLRELSARADQTPPGLPVDNTDGIATISIDGPMIPGPDWAAKYGYAITPMIEAAVKAAAADATIKGIVLAIDSPGGSVDGITELADAIHEASKSKPVLAQVEGTAASAAYFVASQADQIYSRKMDLVGSIGVRMTLYDYSQLFKQAGIEPVIIDTGEFKSTGEIGAKITDSQKAYLQAIVDAFFADFKAAVQRGRGMSAEKLDAVADGRVFVAADAKAKGLIDGIQGMAETRQAILSAAAARQPRTSLSRAKAEQTIMANSLAMP